LTRLAIAGGASAAQYAREAITINREKSKVPETRYTPEFAEEVCQRMAEGASLREVCRENGVPESSVRQWVRDDRDGFAARYQAARTLQVESWSDQIIEIGNREDLDPQDKRVRCDNLKWLTSKLLPKRYGDRLLVAGDAENPLQVLHAQASLDNLSGEALEALDKFTRSLTEAK
jgi:transposase-like protein